MVINAQPNNVEPVVDETDEANEDPNIQTGDGSSEELAVISTEPTANTTETTANNTEKSVNNTKEPSNSTKESTNSNKQSSNSSKQSAKGTEPESANNTKQSVNKTKKSATTTKKATNGTKEVTDTTKESTTSTSTKKLSNNSEKSANSTEPITFGTPYVETDFTGRLSELSSLNSFFLQTQLPTSMARICVVVGMTGIGKTQLVSKFIEENRSAYQNVIWIDSESSQSINDSFKKLAEKINANGERRDAKTAIKEVFNRFCEKNTLFVYDNVRTIESIKFASVRTSSVEGPHILITSPLENWNDRIKVIRMQAWINNDAVDFVSKKLNNSEDRGADIELLVNELKCVPLALRLATAYIMFQRLIFDCFEISEYLSAIKQQKPSGDSERTIVIASANAIRAIQKNPTRGFLALKILNIIAYFAPNNIQREFFLYVATSQQDSSQINIMECVESASHLLTNYAMVTFHNEHTQQHLSIHRSIQNVLKCRLQEAEGKRGEELLLDEALKLISDLSTTFEIEAIVSHAISVFQSAKTYPSLVNTWSTLPAIILLKLLKTYPYDENVPSSQQLKERIQQIEFLQRQLLSLEEQDSDTVTILAVLALQYLSKEVDSDFWKSWKFAVPLVVTGGVVGIVGVSVIKQYVQRATETAVTKAVDKAAEAAQATVTMIIDKAAEATEAAVSKAIEETNQTWIKYATTAAATVAVAAISIATGVNLS